MMLGMMCCEQDLDAVQAEHLRRGDVGLLPLDEHHATG